MTIFNDLMYCETAAEAKRIYEVLLGKATKENAKPVEARYGDEVDDQFESYVADMEGALRENDNNLNRSVDWDDFSNPPAFEALFLDKGGDCFCRVMGELQLREYPDLVKQD
jgi:hypothetical protein